MGDAQNHEPQDLVRALKKLTSRECEVLELVAAGKTNREIADELYLSKRTVENHRYRICKKIGLSGQNALMNWASHHWF